MLTTLLAIAACLSLGAAPSLPPRTPQVVSSAEFALRLYVTPTAKRERNRMAKKIPNPIDRHVGTRVRMRRKMLAMSQTDLGDALGITFQQVQKYENGANGLGANRLQHIPHVLQVPLHSASRVRCISQGRRASASRRDAGEEHPSQRRTRNWCQTVSQ